MGQRDEGERKMLPVEMVAAGVIFVIVAIVLYMEFGYKPF